MWQCIISMPSLCDGHLNTRWRDYILTVLRSHRITSDNRAGWYSRVLEPYEMLYRIWETVLFKRVKGSQMITIHLIGLKVGRHYSDCSKGQWQSTQCHSQKGLSIRFLRPHFGSNNIMQKNWTVSESKFFNNEMERGSFVT